MSTKLDVIDYNGFEILKVISKANAFNTWMYETISPYMDGKILEIGSGIGNISELFIKAGANICLSDIDPYYLTILKEEYGSHSNVTSILSIDLQHENFSTEYAHLKQTFDSIFLLNVLEHLEYPTIAIKNCSFLLKPTGTLLILVPAYSFLFSNIDKTLGHHRRYNSRSLCKLFESPDWEIKTSFYFNTFGILGWTYGKLLKLKRIPAGEMGIFNKLVPFTKWLDTIFFKTVGLSVIAVATKHVHRNL